MKHRRRYKSRKSRFNRKWKSSRRRSKRKSRKLNRYTTARGGIRL